MDWFDPLMRIAHVLAAVTLAGGIFYQCAVLVPAVRGLPVDEATKLSGAMRGTWSKLVMVASLLLLLSGLYNYVVIIRLDRAGEIVLPRYYHPLIGIKILLALFVFFVSSVLAGRSAAAERFRRNESKWLVANSVAAVAIICIAGFLKTSQGPVRPTVDSRGFDAEEHG